MPGTRARWPVSGNCWSSLPEACLLCLVDCPADLQISRSQRFMEGEGVGPRGRPGLWVLDRGRSEGPAVEPKNMENYEIGSTPVLLGVHRETIISIFFYSYSPEGPLCPVPELHKNVSCREARDLLGPPSPSHHRVSSWFVFVLFDFVFFIW